MKVGDIVEVRDGSYSLSYGGSGEVCNAYGVELRDRRFRVLLTDATLPTDDRPRHWNVPPNDLMLCEVQAPEHILFTQQRFCKLFSRPAKVTEKVETRHKEIHRNACRVLARLKTYAPGEDIYFYPETIDGDAVVVFRKKRPGAKLSDKRSVRYTYSKFVPEEDLLDDRGQTGRTQGHMNRIADATLAGWEAITEALDSEAPLL